MFFGVFCFRGGWVGLLFFWGGVFLYRCFFSW